MVNKVVIACNAVSEFRLFFLICVFEIHPVDDSDAS